MPSDYLVSLTPADTLVFKLERDSAPRTHLKITNTSNEYVVFKIKTTQPSWYYVRPNQAILEPGQSEDVTVVLVDTEANRFIDLAAADKPEKLDKHRFLVQTKIVDSAEYERISAMPPALKLEEFGRIWGDGPKDDRKNLKLKVEFVYPANLQEQSADAGSRSELKSVSENVEIVRNRLARATAESSAASPSNFARMGDDGSGAVTSPESIYTELQNLRKKYDAVVEYTVHLTAERDTIVRRLEETERELGRERSRNKSAHQVDSPRGKKSDKTAEKKIINRGFSLTAVLLAALVCFLVGRYYKF